MHACRLTQTLVNALGPPGPEGLFRAGLEAALLALRSRREVRGSVPILPLPLSLFNLEAALLLALRLPAHPSSERGSPHTHQRCSDFTPPPPLQGVAALLDAVLGDAGVEWSAEREDAAARQALELAVALQLFASRMEELRDQIRMQVGGGDDEGAGQGGRERNGPYSLSVWGDNEYGPPVILSPVWILPLPSPPLTHLV